jgi:hypothetical protein
VRGMVAFRGRLLMLARKGFERPDSGVLGPSPPGARSQLLCVRACVWAHRLLGEGKRFAGTLEGVE